MAHESNKENELVITESNIDFGKIYSKSYFPKELEADIKQANMLLIPYEGFRNYDKPVFPEETMHFYNFIKEYENEELIGEICISDEDFVELELHADLISIADMVVNSGVLPIVIGLVTNYIDRKLQGHNTEAKVKVNITEVDGSKSTNLYYEGDADKFEETLKAYKENQ